MGLKSFRSKEITLRNIILYCGTKPLNSIDLGEITLRAGKVRTRVLDWSFGLMEGTYDGL